MRHLGLPAAALLLAASLSASPLLADDASRSQTSPAEAFATSAQAEGRPMLLEPHPEPLLVDGDDQPITVEIADTPREASAGLMFRRSLPDDRGMLFVFDSDRRGSFWMRNTILPLDLIFIDSEGVVDAVRHGIPFDERPIQSNGMIRYVLELNRGQADAFGIEEGTVLRHPLIGDSGSDRS